MWGKNDFNVLTEESQKLLNEGRFEDLQQTVIGRIKNMSPENTGMLQQILGLINRQSLLPRIQSIIADRVMPDNETKRLLDLITSAPTEVDDKQELISFLEIRENLIPGSELLTGEVIDIKSVEPLELQKNETYQHIKQDLMFKSLTGAKQRGAGETFFALFCDSASNASIGDISIDGKEVEVKGLGARMRGDKGYCAAEAGLKVLQDKLSPYVSKISSKAGDYNFTGGGLSLNKMLEQIPVELPPAAGFTTRRDLVHSVFFDAFKEFYTKLKPATFNKYKSKIFDSEGLVQRDALEAVAVLQFDYYKQIAKFDGIMFFNQKTEKVIYIKTASEFEKKINLFNFSHFSWGGNENRSSVHNVTLEG